MNVYDFDKTIYDGDSTLDFYFFCLEKNILLLRYIFIQIYGFLLYKFGFCDKTKFKEYFYCFFKGIDDIDDYVEKFWEKHEYKIKKWYIEQQKKDDIVISASPEFILQPICCKLRIKMLIASKVNKKNGKYSGMNCYGKEKVVRYRKIFNNKPIEEFYSDSYSDTPLAKLAKKAYIVKNNSFKAWDKYDK